MRLPADFAHHTSNSENNTYIKSNLRVIAFAVGRTGVAVVDGGEVNSADDTVAGVVVGGVDNGLVDDGNGNDAVVSYDDDDCTRPYRTLS